MPFLTPTERIGQLIGGRYLIESILAEGGMGTLFKGIDSVAGGQVAIKVLREQSASDQGSISRFQQEAEAIRRLGHPHVVRILDTGQADDGVHFVVMELLQGRSLAQELDDRGRLGAEETLSLLIPLMGALAAAHDAGIIHRDLTPSNIFLHRDEAGDVSPRLIDFGIAKVVGNTRHTKAGTVIGTPEYMSPEQAEGEDASPVFDMWAMGVVIFKCVAGFLPFAAPTPVGVLVKVVNEMAPSLLDVAPDVGKKFCAAVDRALNPNLHSRYSDMRTFASALLAAAKAENMALPRDPDPVGLPEWGKWLSGELPEPKTITGLVQRRKAKGPARQRLRSDDDSAPLIPSDAPSTPDAVASTKAKSSARILGLVAVAGLGALVIALAGAWWMRSRPGAPAETRASLSSAQSANDERRSAGSVRRSGTPPPSPLVSHPTHSEPKEEPRADPSRPVAQNSPDSGSPDKRRDGRSRAEKRASRPRSSLRRVSTASQRKRVPVKATMNDTGAGTEALQATAKGRGNTEIFVNYDD